MRIRSGLFRTFMAAVTLAGVVLIPAGPASAGVWQLTDGFEPGTDPGARWELTESGHCEGPLYQSSSRPTHSGIGFATFEAFAKGDWCALGRTVHLTPVTVHPGARCTAGVWMKLSGEWAQLNVEVIDPDTWRYIALKQVPNNWTDEWSLQTVSWTAQRADVVLRFAVVQTQVWWYSALTELDDVVVQCAY
ncbi:hypothetical protein [Sphaerisporangium corydalis]|uniref:Secreted protein n=1 Tax=Sphaerisporangium corydalis TaxID=1441875 RepID=A0ABV9ELR9_9ACTN|nr:hypothetical protein [Sphaerisporangium corydalis]